MQSWILQGRELGGGEMKWRERKIGTGDGKDRGEQLPAAAMSTIISAASRLRQGRRLRAMPLWGRKLRLQPARSPCPRQPYSLLSSVGSRCGHCGPTLHRALPCTRRSVPHPRGQLGSVLGLHAKKPGTSLTAAPGRAPRPHPTAPPCPALRGVGKEARTRTSGPLVCFFTFPVSVSAGGTVRSPIPDASTL